MIPKPDEQGKRREKETRNQKANYNNKMNGKSREWADKETTKTLDMFVS